jgi:phage-related protein
MATFTWIPDFPIEGEIQPRMRVAQFGDGYAQRVGDGINTMPRVYRPKFTARTQAEAGAIDTFLKANVALAIDWTPANQAAGKFVWTAYKRARANGAYENLEITFEEVFDP